jgi:hypothetical protein
MICLADLLSTRSDTEEADEWYRRAREARN